MYEFKYQLELEQIYDLLELWGGEPEYVKTGIISQTICHNPPGEGSRKLYYYENSKLFKCYTDCVDSSFDIFDLCIRVKKIQEHEDWTAYQAANFIINYFGLSFEESTTPNSKLWEVFQRHPQYSQKGPAMFQLPQYDKMILTRFSYPRIKHWEEEGISPEVYRKNLIGYYAGGEQITIPHFDINNRLIGIRGRTLAEDEADRYGKYRPLYIENTLYSHPLSMNLYHLNVSKDNIARTKAAIIFESEKSCLLSTTFFSAENDISVACCGTNISNYHIRLLRSLGVNEIIVAFDRQFIEIGDEEFQRLKHKLIDLYNRYGAIVRITAIFDKHMLTPYKASPIDMGPDIFRQLLKERIIPKEP